MNAALTPSQRPFKSYELSLLISSIKAADRESEEFKLFQNEFYYRYNSYVLRGCQDFIRSLGETHFEAAKDLFQEIFIKIFKKLPEYQVASDATETKLDRCIKAWMGTIVKREFFKYYAKHKTYSIVDFYDELPLHIYELPAHEDLEVHESEEERKLKDAFSKLKDRDATILRTYAMFDCIHTGKHLPQDIMDQLCQMFQTTPENIRQIKKRTFDKLKDQIKN
jgi:RNA polymerase sigma factor (sigma-70 family)